MHRRAAVAAMTLAFAVGTPLAARSQQRAGNAPAEVVTAIGAARSAWNDAIRARRPDDLGTVVIDTFVFVGPGPGAVEGADNFVSRVRRLARSRPDLVLVYTTERIDGYAPWATATEEGVWNERWSERDGPVTLSGRYLTLWTRKDVGWKAQAMVFGPSSCVGGAYCMPVSPSPSPAPTTR